MTAIRVNVSGADEVRRRLAAMGGESAVTAGQVLYRLGEEIMAEAKQLAPVMDGHLRASGHVDLPEVQGTQVVVEAGFGGLAAPYALSVHENPRAGKTGGISPSGRRYAKWAKVGQWKYLEIPFKKIAPRAAERLRAAIAALAARKGSGGATR